jgi:hypothetical protein
MVTPVSALTLHAAPTVVVTVKLPVDVAAKEAVATQDAKNCTSAKGTIDIRWSDFIFMSRPHPKSYQN